VHAVGLDDPARKLLSVKGELFFHGGDCVAGGEEEDPGYRISYLSI